jgi:hypothetical protein
MGIFNKNPIKKYQRNMRFSANLALSQFKQEGQRTPRVEELIQHTRNFALEVLKLEPENEEAKKFKNFPESMANPPNEEN